jgi:hypothetical protein
MVPLQLEALEEPDLPTHLVHVVMTEVRWLAHEAYALFLTKFAKELAPRGKLLLFTELPRAAILGRLYSQWCKVTQQVHVIQRFLDI